MVLEDVSDATIEGPEEKVEEPLAIENEEEDIVEQIDLACREKTQCAFGY